MNLKLKISPILHKELIDKFGKEDFNKHIKLLQKNSNYTCSCCGWEGAKEMENRQYLTFNVNNIGDTLEDSEIDIVCKSCYIVNHIDLGVKNDFIDFVNSSFDQGDLIRISWSDCQKKSITNNNREKAIIDKKIIVLKKDKNFYLDQIKNGDNSEYLKIIFKDKFLKI